MRYPGRVYIHEDHNRCAHGYSYDPGESPCRCVLGQHTVQHVGCDLMGAGIFYSAHQRVSGLDWLLQRWVLE